MQIAGHENAAGDSEQGCQQYHERHVVQKDRVRHFRGDDTGRMRGNERNEKRQSPECGDLAEMVVPEMRSQKRQQGD
ncbi:hypothetical protein D3C73_752050 [compost metagenome]